MSSADLAPSKLDLDNEGATATATVHEETRISDIDSNPQVISLSDNSLQKRHRHVTYGSIMIPLHVSPTHNALVGKLIFALFQS